MLERRRLFFYSFYLVLVFFLFPLFVNMEIEVGGGLFPVE